MYGYKFYQDWTSGRLPHMIGLMIQNANPYYDDSYAVNSACIGPYGDAIVHELIPEVERRFRAIGQPWARYLYGASTGGWESLAMQVFYPDFFNGAFVLCPDPIDFRAFMSSNIYEDRNAFWNEGPWLRVARPARRTTEDLTTTTIQSWSNYESALGSHCDPASSLTSGRRFLGPWGRMVIPRRFGTNTPERSMPKSRPTGETIMISVISCKETGRLSAQTGGQAAIQGRHARHILSG